MRIQQKYFNKFIGICALITVIVIIYSSISRSQQQFTDFENSISEVQADTISFRSFSDTDSLHISDLPNQPLVIHFWGTWSDKSVEVGNFLKSYIDNQNDLIVIAVSVKDADESVKAFLNENPADFHFVKGTDLYESIKVPGMPTQIFLSSNKQIFDTHVGNDTTEIKNRLDQLLNSE